MLIAVMAVSLIVVGGYGMNISQDVMRQGLMGDMRTRALLIATGEGAVESFVAAAKREAADRVRVEKKGDKDLMVFIREAAAQAEEEVRANVSNSMINYDAVDVSPVTSAVFELRAALVEYYAEERAAQRQFLAERQLTEETALIETPDEPAGDIAMEGLDDLPATPDEPLKADLTGFVATPEMERLWAVVEDEYQGVAASLKEIYPVLDDDALTQIKSGLMGLIYQNGDTFDSEFERLGDAGGLRALSSEDAMTMRIARLGMDLIAIGVALALLSLIVLFYRAIVKAIGLPRLIIGGFFVLLCLMSVIKRLSITMLLSNTLVRMGMNSIMVLAMVPSIQCGIKLNLGLPIGIVGGLLGGLLCVELGFAGWPGFLFAVVVGFVISAVLGVLYGVLLNRIKGSEMAVTTYVGFSIIALMCIGWLVFPFKSLVLRWPLGNGLRQTASLEPAFQYILDRFLAFKIGELTVPTGLLLFMLLCCLVVWLFMRSKTGVAMAAAGNNPRFAEATGINVDRMRVIGTTLSMMLGSLGIIVYSQSFGFMQLYTHPRTLGLVAASAILIGGASTSRARISHVLIGTFLFQGVLTLGMPVANALVPGSTIAETLRILVSNGIILYALTKSGGGSHA